MPLKPPGVAPKLTPTEALTIDTMLAWEEQCYPERFMAPGHLLSRSLEQGRDPGLPDT